MLSIEIIRTGLRKGNEYELTLTKKKPFFNIHKLRLSQTDFCVLLGTKSNLLRCAIVEDCFRSEAVIFALLIILVATLKILFVVMQVFLTSLPVTVSRQMLSTLNAQQ